MRTLLVLAVLAALVAGCTTNNGNDNGATPPTGGNTTGTGSTMAPKQAATDSHDFATDALSGTPAAQGSTKAFTVDPGYTTLNLTVTWEADQGAPASGVAQDLVVKVGSLSCTVSAGPFQGASPCTKTGPATAGPAKIEYSGAGPVTATVKVTET